MSLIYIIRKLKLTRYASVSFFLLFLSCSTQESEFDPQQNETIVLTDIANVKNGILSFQSIDSYVNLIDEKNSDRKLELVRNLNSTKEYNSLRSLSIKNVQKNGKTGKTLSSQEEELIETNDFITTLINADGLIRIGDYFFKINLATKTCLVLSKNFESQIPDLISENTQNSNIMIFSTDDEVLYLLQEGVKGTKTGRTDGLFCRDSSADAKKSDGFDYEADDFRMDNKVVYQKVAIYFSLQAKTKIQYRSQLGVWVENSDCGQMINYYYHIHPKCVAEFEETGLKGDDDCGNELNHRPYERSYAINKYWYSVKFYGYSIWSGVYEIRDGY